MHIKVQRFSRLFTTLLVALCVPFLIKLSVAASTVTVNGLNSNQARITDSSGQIVSNTQDLDEYNYYQVSYNWSIPDSEIIQPGDTAQFTLPSNVRIPSTETFDITDNAGNVVGHVENQAGAATGTITFTNIPSSFRYNRHGFLR